MKFAFFIVSFFHISLVFSATTRSLICQPSKEYIDKWSAIADSPFSGVCLYQSVHEENKRYLLSIDAPSISDNDIPLFLHCLPFLNSKSEYLQKMHDTSLSPTVHNMLQFLFQFFYQGVFKEPSPDILTPLVQMYAPFMEVCAQFIESIDFEIELLKGNEEGSDDYFVEEKNCLAHLLTLCGANLKSITFKSSNTDYWQSLHSTARDFQLSSLQHVVFEIAGSHSWHIDATFLLFDFLSASLTTITSLVLDVNLDAINLLYLAEALAKLSNLSSFHLGLVEGSRKILWEELEALQRVFHDKSLINLSLPEFETLTHFHSGDVKTFVQFANISATSTRFIMSAYNSKDSTNYVIKRYPPKSYELAKNEIEALKIFKENPLFVKFQDNYTVLGYSYLVLECISGLSVAKFHELLDTDKIKRPSDKHIMKISYQLLTISEMLDNHGYLEHRIKAENIMLVDDDFTIKILDFSNAVKITNPLTTNDGFRSLVNNATLDRLFQIGSILWLLISAEESPPDKIDQFKAELAMTGYNEAIQELVYNCFTMKLEGNIKSWIGKLKMVID